MAKKAKPEGKKYNYMDTYGDLVTLLLCFFVLLFAMSTVEETKYNVFVEALSARFGSTSTNFSFVPEDASDVEDNSEVADMQPTGEQMDADQSLPADLGQLAEAISRYVQESGLEGDVSVEKTASGATFIRISNNLLFPPNEDTLRPAALDLLNFLSESFNSIEDEILMVKFNGHTASVESSPVDDWLLAAGRAGQVSSYISNTGGFNRFKIQSSFYGRNYPIADNGTDDGRTKNRRVDIIVLGNDADRLMMTMEDAMRVYFPDDDTQFFEGDAEDLPDNMIDSVYPNAADGDMLAGLTEDEIDAILNGESLPGTAEAPEDTGAASG